MEAKNKANAENLNDTSAATDFELKVQAKEKELEELRAKVEETEEREKAVAEKHENMKTLMTTHQGDLEKIIESCKVKKKE